jgi:hypothetical protein
VQIDVASVRLLVNANNAPYPVVLAATCGGALAVTVQAPLGSVDTAVVDALLQAALRCVALMVGGVLVSSAVVL